MMVIVLPLVCEKRSNFLLIPGYIGQYSKRVEYCRSKGVGRAVPIWEGTAAGVVE